MGEDIGDVLREVHGRRKYAPLHWKARAENAHAVASVLWASRDKGQSTAMWEGYLREAAIALELILKAVIVARIEVLEMPPHILEESHDLPKLWRIAELPDLDREDRYRLAYFKSIIVWLGRYPTPRTPEFWKKDMRDRELNAPYREIGNERIRKHTACGFPEFDRLYQAAFLKFSEILTP